MILHRTSLQKPCKQKNGMKYLRIEKKPHQPRTLYPAKFKEFSPGKYRQTAKSEFDANYEY